MCNAFELRYNLFKHRKFMNGYIFLMAVLWIILETAFFGWNLTPLTLPELIADGFGLLLIVIAVIVGDKSE